MPQMPQMPQMPEMPSPPDPARPDEPAATAADELPATSTRRILVVLAPLSRREVLRGMGLLLAGATAGGCSDEGPASIPGATTSAASQLGAGPYRTLHALADAVLPQPPQVPWDAGSLRVAERLAGLLVGSGDEVLDAARAGLRLLEHAPISTELSMSRFSRAARTERQSILRAWAESRVAVKRLVASSLRRAVVFTAYASEETWIGLGYDGPWVREGAAAPVLCPLGMGAGQRAAGGLPTPSALSWPRLGE